MIVSAGEGDGLGDVSLGVALEDVSVGVALELESVGVGVIVGTLQPLLRIASLPGVQFWPGYGGSSTGGMMSLA